MTTYCADIFASSLPHFTEFARDVVRPDIRIVEQQLLTIVLTKQQVCTLKTVHKRCIALNVGPCRQGQAE